MTEICGIEEKHNPLTVNVEENNVQIIHHQPIRIVTNMRGWQRLTIHHVEKISKANKHLVEVQTKSKLVDSIGGVVLL